MSTTARSLRPVVVDGERTGGVRGLSPVESGKGTPNVVTSGITSLLYLLLTTNLQLTIQGTD